ncbi:tail fiber assembly protein [Escherichia coli]|uniref:tail fiber assembly protein n=1 Tax=Escherichia coli TaxID=562 RepID=UPI000CF0A051|nr:tail fiber assembly protein [Escherichia coli]EHU9754973.1 tail fiber assembly protein [Escherichia coli]EKK2586418.1 tail fiber assembly protein [Escherichia coli]ELM8992376.1 tail fiber assembly protein [Escherichia coli]ELY0753661.1 tail fiber assembly protein [Escherichia coli]MBV4704440.1 tail fiber assembly protein [Escherichia coli]
MDKFFYSPSKNEFYLSDLRSEYLKSGAWPEDSVEVSDDVVFDFIQTPAEKGKMRIAGDDGLPEWTDIPAPTQEEMIESNEDIKAALRAIADAEIAWRQDAVDVGIATEVETAALTEWKKYRVLLMRVETADPEWPTPPATQAS